MKYDPIFTVYRHYISEVMTVMLFQKRSLYIQTWKHYLTRWSMAERPSWFHLLCCLWTWTTCYCGVENVFKLSNRIVTWWLKLKRNWGMQQENNRKYWRKYTIEWFGRGKFQIFKWPTQRPDLNPLEMLWCDTNRAVHTRHPKNMAEFYEEEFSQIPPRLGAGQWNGCYDSTVGRTILFKFEGEHFWFLVLPAYTLIPWTLGQPVHKKFPQEDE